MEVKKSATRSIAYGTNTLILTLSLLGILVLVNFFFSRHFIRFDLTEKKEYSIAASTKNMLAGLDDIITVKAYFSKKLPPQAATVSSQVRDILDEFSAFSKGNIQYEFLDPADNPDIEQSLRFEGIPQVQLNVIENDKIEVMNAYLGLSLYYEDKKEVIPIVKSANNLEYELASRLVKLTIPEKKTVGILPRTPEDKQEYTELQKMLEEQYSVEWVNLVEGPTIPSQVNTLLVLGPKEMSEENKRAIDAFIMKGGRTIFMVDMIELNQGSLDAFDIRSNLGDMLNHYGLKVEEGVVADIRSNDMASFSSGMFQYVVQYPFFPRVIKGFFDEENPAVAQLENLVLQWTSPVALTLPENSPVKGTVLARTTPYAFVQKVPYMLNPQQRLMPPNDELKSIPLVVGVSGSFTSFYSNSRDTVAVDDVPVSDTSPATDIVLIGSSKLMQDKFLRMSRAGGANLVFMSNLVDSLTLGSQLLSIRSRGEMNRPIGEISEAQKTTVRFINIFGGSIIVLLIGVWRYFSRKRAQRRYVMMYTSS